MAEILEGAYQDAVRSEFGVSIDELSNAEIDSPFVLGFAEASMLKQYPEWESFSEVDSIFFQRAVLLKVCLVLCPRLKLKVRAEESDGKTTEIRFKNIDWAALEASFRSSMHEALQSVEALAANPLMTIVSPATDAITGS